MDTTTHHPDDVAGDILLGADAINAFLAHLGMTDANVYYLKRSGWPIGKTNAGRGGKLLASKRRLARHTQKLAATAG